MRTQQKRSLQPLRGSILSRQPYRRRLGTAGGPRLRPIAGGNRTTLYDVSSSVRFGRMAVVKCRIGFLVLAAPSSRPAGSFSLTPGAGC